jgi:hypothetical protein
LSKKAGDIEKERKKQIAERFTHHKENSYQLENPNLKQGE